MAGLGFVQVFTSYDNAEKEEIFHATPPEYRETECTG